VRGFFAELKRRNVLRAAVLYIGAVWALAQGIAQLGPPLGAPAGIVRWFVIAGIIGFPFWTAFAWLYQLTPEGLKRESEIAPGESIAHSTGRKLDFAIIGVLAIAVVLLLTNTFVWHAGLAPGGEATGIGGAQSPISPRSIAVLPLVNQTGNNDEQYFSDGLSQDLITALAQFSGLKVVGREASFRFRGSDEGSATIGRRLGVANLLEGSVQRVGNTVRISASLIKASDGSIVWSQHYDRPFKDLFKLQDDITGHVAAALKAKLLTAPGAVKQSDRPPGGNLDAYVAYLRGRSVFGDEAQLHEAVKANDEAIRIDPHYAAAYAGLSRAWSVLGEEFLQGAKMHEAYAKSLAAANTAIALDPNLAAGHRARAEVLLRSRLDFAGFNKEMARADELEPNRPSSRAVLARDPKNHEYWFTRASKLADASKFDEAIKAQRTGIAMGPDGWPPYMSLLLIEVRARDAKAALKSTSHLPAGIWRDYGVALALQIGDDRPAADWALENLIHLGKGYAAFQIAIVYAVRKDPDNMFKWLEHAWDIRDPGLQQLWNNPFLKPYHDGPRFIAFAKKIGLPEPAAKPPANTAAQHPGTARSPSPSSP
jgi:TolB-like protein/tetratricopeptide (TPR) repeat protein